MSIKKVLILTLTAGGGHIQAAKAKYMETKAQLPDTNIIEVDILYDWIWKYFGKFAKHMWGDAQARGNVFFLVCLSHALKLADYIFWLPFFLHAARMCKRENIDKIIDTQPLATSAVIKALRFIKWRTGKEIVYEKVLTDLPTVEAKHFFGGIKSLSKKDSPFLKVLTTRPILGKDETEADFWKKNCNLPLSSILYAPLPLRPAFFQFGLSPERAFSLNLSIPCASDLHLTYKTLSFGSLQAKRSKHSITIPIESGDKVALMMLGANPNPEAILAYTNHFIHRLQAISDPTRNDLFFIFCSSQVTIKPNLRTRILNLLEKTKNYPKNLTIIPISHQNDMIIAPLLHRSDATITRSGGLTSMELLSVASGKIYIHKEPSSINLPKFIPSTKIFHEGMPSWESGNARYLELRKGAQIITPETFETVTNDYFSLEKR